MPMGVLIGIVSVIFLQIYTTLSAESVSVVLPWPQGTYVQYLRNTGFLNIDDSYHVCFELNYAVRRFYRNSHELM
jgi:hypothetical protein